MSVNFYELIKNATQSQLMDASNFLAHSATVFLTENEFLDMMERGVKDKNINVLGSLWLVIVENRDFKKCRLMVDLLKKSLPNYGDDVIGWDVHGMENPVVFVEWWLHAAPGTKMEKNGTFKPQPKMTFGSDDLLWLLNYLNDGDDDQSVNTSVVFEALLKSLKKIDVNDASILGWIDYMAIKINQAIDEDVKKYGIAESKYENVALFARRLLSPLYTPETVASREKYFQIIHILSEKCPRLWPMKIFFPEILNELRSDDDKLNWMHVCEEYIAKSGDKKCLKLLNLTKKQLGSGKFGPVVWWEKEQLGKLVGLEDSLMSNVPRVVL